jgi:glycosyltransferase involved in cell wall biosynthesis
MKEFRVIHIDSERGWRGGQQQAIYLFEAMLNLGYQTEFICKKNSQLARYLKDHDLPFLAMNLWAEWDFISAFKIAVYAKKNNFKILHLHNAHAVTIGLISKLFFRRLKLIAVRRVDFTIKKNLFSAFKYQHKYLDKIVAISQNIRIVLLSDEVDASRIELIHSGVDTEKFANVNRDESLRNSLGILAGDIAVGTIAALAGHKDYPTLLRAAREVIRQNGKVHFLAAGDGPQKQELQRLARNLKIEKRFHFLGYRRDIGLLLKSFDIFVLASKKEGLGTSVLDAMIAGVPIIATDAGGIPEMIEHELNGFLVPKENPQALADAILKLISDRKKQEYFVENAKRIVRNFAIENTVKKNLELYEKLSG